MRLDAVHYCAREYNLSEKRKRRSFFERNGDPKDATQQRLQLFSTTVRANLWLGSLVEILKMPYMTRETCKADLARTVSVLPNLQYVDLPDGFFSDDPSSTTLKQELQHRCPEIRKMKYSAGAESSFTLLGHTRQWQGIEILELKGLTIEPESLLYVLASFPFLREVKISDVKAFDNNLLTPNPHTPPFPPLTKMTIENSPKITAAGLTAYLSRPEIREVLTSLTLNETGVLAQDLHKVLASADHLQVLTINAIVERSFPISPVPPLASKSLRTLYFEVLPHTNSNPASETYYTYLATSLLSGSLPQLSSLYAYSPTLPDLLLYPPVAPFGGSGNSSRFSAYSAASSASSVHSGQPNLPTNTLAGLMSPLNLYTKPATAPELEWSVTIIDPPSERNGRRGSISATRPLSLVQERNASPHSFSSRNNNSVLVGNGFGGFLAVPGEEYGGGGASNQYGRRGSKTAGKEWMG